jgi:hypothetical protein
MTGAATLPALTVRLLARKAPRPRPGIAPARPLVSPQFVQGPSISLGPVGQHGQRLPPRLWAVLGLSPPPKSRGGAAQIPTRRARQTRSKPSSAADIKFV